MSNNDHNYSTCAFGEEMLAYFYGEATADEAKKCAAHLQICPSCADEMEHFGATRAAILEWRAEDFSPLTTPAIQVLGVQTTTAGGGKQTWAERFRSLFAFNPAFAAAGLIVLIFSVGAFFLIFNFSGNQEVARVSHVEKLTQPSVSPTIESLIEPASKNSTPDGSAVAKEKPLIVNDDSSKSSKREKEIVPTKAGVKVSSGAAKNDAESLIRVKDLKNDAKKPSPVKKQAIPAFDENEDEDDSLRLSDLFAELDAK